MVGFLINLLAHMLIETFYWFFKRGVRRWAANKTAYALTSLLQLLIMLACPVLAMLGGLMAEGAFDTTGGTVAFGCAVVCFIHGLVVAVLMATIYERATGVSLWTGKPTPAGDARVTPGGRIKRRNMPEVEPTAPFLAAPRIPWHAVARPAASPRFHLPHWTWRATICLGLAAGLGLAAWFASNPLLYFPACAVLLALVLEYLLDLYAAVGMPHIEIRREVPALVGEDDTVEVKLFLRNPGRTVNNLVVVDNFAPEEEAYRERKVMVGRLPGNGTGEYTYEANCWRRGVWRVGPLELRRESPLAVFKNRNVRLESSLIHVYPHLYPSPSWAQAMGGARERVGLGTTDKAGWSSEFYGVREYQPGDPRRLIHWPSTAKCMTLMVKELEMAVDFDLTAIIDLNRFAVTGQGKHTTFEYMVKIIGSLCREMLRKCHNLNVVALGDGVRSIRCSRGMTDLPLILDFLTEQQPEGHLPLELTLEQLQAQLKSDSTLIVPLQRPNLKMVEILSLLRMQGIESRVLLFDAASFQVEPEQAMVESTAYLTTMEALRNNGFRVAGVNREMGPSQPVFYRGWG
jgi:uncharacterized protein (DUF58 family)